MNPYPAPTSVVLQSFTVTSVTDAAWWGTAFVASVGVGLLAWAAWRRFVAWWDVMVDR